jgi:hypothetical protein
MKVVPLPSERCTTRISFTGQGLGGDVQLAVQAGEVVGGHYRAQHRRGMRRLDLGFAELLSVHGLVGGAENDSAGPVDQGLGGPGNE